MPLPNHPTGNLSEQPLTGKLAGIMRFLFAHREPDCMQRSKKCRLDVDKTNSCRQRLLYWNMRIRIILICRARLACLFETEAMQNILRYG